MSTLVLSSVAGSKQANKTISTKFTFCSTLSKKRAMGCGDPGPQIWGAVLPGQLHVPCVLLWATLRFGTVWPEKECGHVEQWSVMRGLRGHGPDAVWLAGAWPYCRRGCRRGLWALWSEGVVYTGCDLIVGVAYRVWWEVWLV